MKPTYRSGTNLALEDSIRLVLDFTSDLLEMRENPFGNVHTWEEEDQLKSMFIAIICISSLSLKNF